MHTARHQSAGIPHHQRRIPARPQRPTPLPSAPWQIIPWYHAPQPAWPIVGAKMNDDSAQPSPMDELLTMAERVRAMSPEQQQRLLQLMQEDLAAAPLPAMDDVIPTQVSRFDWDADDADDDDEDDEEDFQEEFDSDEWKQLQEFELPESIRQLFAEAGVLDAMPEGSAGPQEEVPMPWDSTFANGPLIDERRPQTMEAVDGEPAYIEEVDEEGLPWDGRRLEKRRAAERRKKQRGIPPRPTIPDNLHNPSSVRVVNLDGTELTDEEAEELFGLSDQAMLDDDVVDDSDEDDIPIQVRERVEEHLARFEKGAVVEPPESFKGLVPEDGEAFVKRIHAIRDRYEDTHLPADERIVSQEEQRAAEDEELANMVYSTPFEEDDEDVAVPRPAPEVPEEVKGWFHRHDWIMYLLRRQHIDGDIDGPVRALMDAGLVADDVLCQDPIVNLTGVGKWLQYMTALKRAGAHSVCDVHILSTTGTARPVPQMDIVVDHFVHIPWPAWYRAYVVNKTGQAMEPMPAEAWNMVNRWREDGSGVGGSSVLQQERRFSYDPEGWDGERPDWEDDSFFTNLMGEFESSAASLLSEQPGLKVLPKQVEVEEGDEWLSGDCFTIMATTRYGVDAQLGKVTEVQSLWNKASGFTGQLVDILDVYLMTTGLHRWRFDHHDALTVLPNYVAQQPAVTCPPSRWYRPCKGRKMMVVQRAGVRVQPGRTEGWGGFTRQGGNHVLMGPIAIDFQQGYNEKVEEQDAYEEANWDPEY